MTSVAPGAGVVDAGGVRLSYEIFGAGDPVVLVCATGMPAFVWQISQVPAFVAAGYQVVTFDNRGVAPSDTPPGPYSVAQLAADAAALLDHLGLTGCRLLGYSLGGFVVEELAATRPDLVRAAVMVASAGRASAFMRRSAVAERDMFAALRDDVPESIVATNLLRDSVPLRTLQDDDAAVEQWFAALTAMPWEGPGRSGQYHANWSWLLDDTRTERWPALSMPFLLVSFENDVMFPPSKAREMATELPNAEFHLVGDGAHGSLFDHVDAVNAVVVDFFGRV